MFGLTIASVLLLLICLAGVALPICALVLLVRTPAPQRSLPAVLWALIILAFPFVGSIAFLVVGRR